MTGHGQEQDLILPLRSQYIKGQGSHLISHNTEPYRRRFMLICLFILNEKVLFESQESVKAVT